MKFALPLIRFGRLLIEQSPVYNRPAEQPSCDDPGPRPDFPLTKVGTPRGKTFVVAFEWGLFGDVRGLETPDTIEVQRQYFRDRGYEFTG